MCAMKSLGLFSVLVLCYIIGGARTSTEDAEAVVITVASNETDGFKRYLRSADVYGLSDNLQVLGMNKPWKGGNMNYAGGGYKVNLLKKKLEEYKEDEKKIILFTDSYDVIFLNSLDAIVKKFKTLDARILFSAETYCWPDESLASKYPTISRGALYLNSGGFIGYASDLYALLAGGEIKDTDDDQLYYTKIYLDPKLRAKYNMKLDHKSEIFQNLFGAIADVTLEFKDDEAYLHNTVYDTIPMIVHGNGHSKLILNALGNYLASAWNREDGCLSCWDESIELPDDEPKTWPTILLALFVDVPTPFLEEFFVKISKQMYPKSKMHLFIYNNVAYHEKLIADFVDKYGSEYRSLKQILPNNFIKDSAARELAMDYCLLKECSGFFAVDSVSHLDNEHTLNLLVEQQRGIVAPMLVRPYETWSNFWGAIASNGYYARSSDYMQIVANDRRGLWNVPYITHCYLINATIIKNKATRPSFSNGDLDFDMAFAESNRKHDVFMYVSNRLDFGHLVNADDFNIKFTNPDMYDIFNNKYDWEKRYIHANYGDVFKPNATSIQPCPDVYWFPIVTERFTKELIEIVETYGQWSDGSNRDSRIQGGYENVPTRDIHMKQVSYEPQWLRFLKDYVRPLQELVFTGYIHDDPRIPGGYENVPTRDIHLKQVDLEEAWLLFLKRYVAPLQELAFPNYTDDPPRSHMNFVVRYKPDEQPSLKPHHDASTYTINIALNNAGIDYEGGGCRFIRYNCSVTDTKPGWMLMHPGRLTHYHEGLTVKSGTRYIMISFVDP